MPIKTNMTFILILTPGTKFILPNCKPKWGIIIKLTL